MMPTPRSSIKWRMFSGAVPKIVRSDTRRNSTGVVRDQPVPALHELHGCFALADAALAQDENALAVNLYKYAVPA